MRHNSNIFVRRGRPAVFPLTGVLLALGLAILAGPTFCQATPAELKGTISVSGAWALYPMMVRWAEEFQKLHPGVKVDISAGGAGKGATDALAGMVDIGMVSRDIHPEEEQKGGFWIPVVKDAVIPTANASNPLAKVLATRGLKRDTLRTLWIDGKELTWGKVLGQSGNDDPIQVYTRSDSCGAAETWAKYLGGAQEDLQGVAVYGDPGLAETVKKDSVGIGFNNLNYLYDSKTGKPVAGLMALPIDLNGNGNIDKTETFYATKTDLKRAIATGAYPSPPARNLNVLMKGKPKGLTRTFLLWILSDGQKFVDEAGYIELSPKLIADAKTKMK